jgi:hypothetical protein
MPDLKILDSLIAIVVVILVLSFIVQSIQGALKKLFKIKSRQIEDSLLDLFENALGAPSSDTQTRFSSSPVLRVLTLRKHPAENAHEPVRILFKAVSTKFREIGRVAQSGRWTLDSLAKQDLLKVLAQVAPGTILPSFTGRLEEACKQVKALEEVLAGIDGSRLSGTASARLAALRQALVPMINDVGAIFDGQKLEPSLLVGDTLRLREVKREEVMGLLEELQEGVDQEIATARTAGQATQALEAASAALKTVAGRLTDLFARFDAALAPLRTRLSAVESWFDTVMQSFEERYARGMRTWAVVISLAVVVASNASFFRIMEQILTNDLQRASIVAAGERLQQLETQQAAPVAPGAQQTTDLGPLIEETRGQIEKQADLYSSLGFEPLSRKSLEAGFATPGTGLKTAAGWLLMALLLSVGAPFWQDTLESLFGLKNLLRKRGDIKNVEQQSGAGYTKAT